jgi:hypothetical protein
MSAVDAVDGSSIGARIVRINPLTNSYKLAPASREAVAVASRTQTFVRRTAPSRLDTQIFEGRGAATNVDKSQCAGPSGSGKISSGAGDEADYH